MLMESVGCHQYMKFGCGSTPSQMLVAELDGRELVCIFWCLVIAVFFLGNLMVGKD